jgi:hypothetical protein
MVTTVRVLQERYVRTAQCKAVLRPALRRSVGALRPRLTPFGAVSISEQVTGGQKPAKSAGSSCAREASAARSTPCTQAVVRSTRLPRGRTQSRPRASPVPADAKNLHHFEGGLIEKGDEA